MPTTETPTLAPLRRDLDFRRVFAASAAGKLGTQVSFLAVPLVAVSFLSATPGQVGVLGALANAAWLLIGLPAGAWVDRMRRRPVMIAADLVRALLLISVPVAWWAGALTLTQLYAVVFAVGVATVFSEVAGQSLIPTLVGRDRVTEANAALVGLDSVLTVGGRSGAGALIGVIGAPLAVIVDACGYLFSALFLSRVRAPEPVAAPVRRSLLAEIREGVVLIWRNPVLRPIAIAGTGNNIAAIIVITMLPVRFVGELHVSELLLGVFFALGGLGTFAGAALTSRLVARLGRRRMLILPHLIGVPFALLVPLADAGTWLWVAAAGWLIGSARFGVTNVIGVSYRQQATPDHLLGRMNATMRFLFTGALAVGALLAGVLGDRFGVVPALWTGTLLAALAWLPVLAIPKSDG
ncbi:MFS transporter [Actinorhabdospora filicis]|uniref:MFS transporter n=1 Tax=Actinorhabdospora filicis TaxID=1785913 RepID=A0A9W6SL55_9ACTN|nr:MFS transporter [Actinorhabdospora filicis]GLZ77709.1 MFS transporter [Actinorhabdospora filicis]